MLYYCQGLLGVMGLVSLVLWMITGLTKVFGFHDMTISTLLWWALGYFITSILISLWRKLLNER